MVFYDSSPISQTTQGRDATGIEWVEVRDTAKHATMHRTAATMNNYPPTRSLPALPPSVNNARLRNPSLEAPPYFLLQFIF